MRTRVRRRAEVLPPPLPLRPPLLLLVRRLHNTMMASMTASAQQRAASAAVVKHEARRQLAGAAAGAATGAKASQRSGLKREAHLGRRRRPRPPGVQGQLPRLQPSMLRGRHALVSSHCARGEHKPLVRRACMGPALAIAPQICRPTAPPLPPSTLCSCGSRGAGACTRSAGGGRGGVLHCAAVRLAGAAVEPMKAAAAGPGDCPSPAPPSHLLALLS